jgi:2-isopropylmalate synthase
MPTNRVTIFDTTLRDGEQAPGFSLRTSEKVELARQLDALGVDLIEAGFPIASLDDAEGVRQVAAVVRRPIIAALARCRPEDIERAGESLKGAERSRFTPSSRHPICISRKTEHLARAMPGECRRGCHAGARLHR